MKPTAIVQEGLQARFSGHKIEILDHVTIREKKAVTELTVVVDDVPVLQAWHPSVLEDQARATEEMGQAVTELIELMGININRDLVAELVGRSIPGNKVKIKSINSEGTKVLVTFLINGKKAKGNLDKKTLQDLAKLHGKTVEETIAASLLQVLSSEIND